MMKSAVILAAGLSSRMQSFKPLLPFGGATVIESTAARLREGGAEELVIVTGFLAAEVERVFRDQPVRFVHNRDFARSQMFDSVKLGLAAAGGEEIFLLPADLPQFDPAVLDALSAAPGQAAHPVCGSQNGHPLLLRRGAVETVLAHGGERGLKGALERVPTAAVETRDRGCVMDIDTPEDYAALLAFRAAGVPTAWERAALFARYGTPDSVRAHGAAVCRTAMELADGLPGIDRDLLESAALLHDAARAERDHPRIAAEELERLGYGKLAAVVRVHMDLPEALWETAGEPALLYLADKLVAGERRVSLKQRFRGAEERFWDRPEILDRVRSRRAVAETILKRVKDLQKSAYIL